MKLIIKLAWRNIWRNNRRSLLTIIAITFAALSAITLRGLQLGTYNQNIKNAVTQFTGYLQIQPVNYQNEPALNKTVKLSKAVKSYLDENKSVKGYSQRVAAEGLISFKDNSFGSMIIGISPSREKEITRFVDNTSEGHFFDSDSSDKIVLGYKLLKNLQAEIGDTVIVLAQDFDGSLGNMKFVIAGTVKMGSYEFDAMAVFMGIETARNLLAMYGKTNIVAVSLNSLDQIDEVKNSLSQIINKDKAVVLKWDEVIPELKQLIALDNLSGIIFLAILVIVVAFGILNTVLMSVTERFKEFGIILAVGMQQNKLMLIVFIETLMLTLVGITIGVVLGFSVNLYFINNPIVLSSELTALYQEYGFLPIMKSTLMPSVFIQVALGIIIVSLLASVYPIYKTYKLEPLKGIRYT